MTKYFIWETDNQLFNSKDEGILIKNIAREFLPPISTSTIKVGKRAGEVLQENTLGSRNITFDIAFMHENEAHHRKAIRSLAGALYYNREGRLTISDEPDVFYNAQLTGASGLDSTASIGETSLNFLCGDPFAYKAEYNQLFEAGAVRVFNDGTAETYPRFRIVPVNHTTFIKLMNETKGEQILLNGEFLALEAIIIDTKTNNVYREATGERIMTAVDLSSDFFSLDPQTETHITVQPAGTTARIYIQERFL